MESAQCRIHIILYNNNNNNIYSKIIFQGSCGNFCKTSYLSCGCSTQLELLRRCISCASPNTNLLLFFGIFFRIFHNNNNKTAARSNDNCQQFGTIKRRKQYTHRHILYFPKTMYKIIIKTYCSMWNGKSYKKH